MRDTSGGNASTIVAVATGVSVGAVRWAARSGLAIGFALIGSFASACTTLPATLTNGTPADANQVMSDFDGIVTCPVFPNDVFVGTTTTPLTNESTLVQISNTGAAGTAALTLQGSRGAGLLETSAVNFFNGATQIGQVEMLEDATTMNGALTFSTAANGNLAEVLRITSGGDLLIGGDSTTPLSSENTVFQVSNNQGGNTAAITLRGNRGAGSVETSALNFYNAATRIGQVEMLEDATTTNGALTFSTAASGSLAEVMRITSDGDVLMGGDSTTPLSSENTVFQVSNDLTGHTAALTLRGNRGGSGSPETSAVNFYNNATQIGQIETIADASSTSGAIVLSTASGGTLTEVMRANSAGTVAIHAGTATTAGYSLYVEGSAAGTTSWGSISDGRLKRDVETIPDALGLVQQLRGVEFYWRAPSDRPLGKTLALPVNERQVGFVAQEVEKVIPEAVTPPPSGSDAPYSVSESKIVAVLVEAVKEQQAEIAQLKAQIASLKR